MSLSALERAISSLGVPRGKLGNVVFLPGILGSDLADANNQELWIFPPNLKALFLASDGVSEADSARAVHPLTPNFPHAALLHALELSWNVLPFAYDWRKNIMDTARQLQAAIVARFGDQPFHIVAHSMGGLVARVLRAMFRGIQRGGKFVMLATPNHGSFLAVKALTLDTAAIALLRLYGVNAPADIAMAAARTWPGAYQLLPCPIVDTTIQPFYSNPPAELSRSHIAAAAQFHAFLHNNSDTTNTIYIGGSHIPTLDGFTSITTEGDGVVSSRLGFLAGASIFTVLGGHVDLL